DGRFHQHSRRGNRLWRAAVPDGGRPVGDDGHDGLRQSGARFAVDARRLYRRDADELVRLAVLRRAADGGDRRGGGGRAGRAHNLQALLLGQSARPGAADHRHRHHDGRGRDLRLGRGAARGECAVLPRRPRPYRLFRHRLVSPVPDRVRRRAAGGDNRRMTVSCGINIDRLFMLAFAIGSALAGLGGGLAIYLVGLDPSFPVKYLVYLLVVVVVGGMGSIRGTLAASLALGICDVVGKYYI